MVLSTQTKRKSFKVSRDITKEIIMVLFVVGRMCLSLGKCMGKMAEAHGGLLFGT